MATEQDSTSTKTTKETKYTTSNKVDYNIIDRENSIIDYSGYFKTIQETMFKILETLQTSELKTKNCHGCKDRGKEEK
tara:strand:+ start:1089 stop:1322 length:234 start_codon:yes stop_codon:yes gene_type:complete